MTGSKLPARHNTKERFETIWSTVVGVGEDGTLFVPAEDSADGADGVLFVATTQDMFPGTKRPPERTIECIAGDEHLQLSSVGAAMAEMIFERWETLVTMELRLGQLASQEATA